MARQDLRLYRQFFPLLRPYRRRLAMSLGASMARPLLGAASIWVLKILIDTALPRRQAGLLAAVAAGLVAVAVVRAVIVSWDERLGGWVGTQVVRDLRVRVYAHLHQLSLRYYHQQKLGDLLTRLTSDIAAIEDLLVSGLTDLVAYLVTIALFSGLLIYLSPQLMLVALCVLPLGALSSFIGARRGRRAQEHIRAAASRITSTAEEGLSAIALVKSFARGTFEAARFADASEQSAEARLRAVRIRATFPPFEGILASVGTAAVIWIGAQQVLAGQLSLGSLVVFISYLGALYTPIQGLSRVSSVVQRALVGAGRLGEILEAPGDQQERRGFPPLPPVRGELELRRVTFGYLPLRPVLMDVSLRVSPGEVVALVGASGAGKTTVVSLLLSFYDPSSGSVCLDGHPLHLHDPGSNREQVAAVLQEPMLFNASVRENIRYGRLDATDADVQAAASVAQAHAFVCDLDDGYDTVVGPRGARLSGGQRQRLAIARAVIKAAPVLILDEATSALDPVTETLLLSSLRAACADRSVLLVAHRYATVRHADRIVVLDQGRVVEEGTQAELLDRDGAYAAFARSQVPCRPSTQAAHGPAGTALAAPHWRVTPNPPNPS